MAPAKNTRSQSAAAKDSRIKAEGAGEITTQDEETKVTTTQSHRSKDKIEEWLHVTVDGGDSQSSDDVSEPKTATKSSATSAIKRQRRVSSYFRGSKSLTNCETGEKEKIEKEEVTTAVSQTTATEVQTVIRTRSKTVIDTTTVTTTASDSGKKRKCAEEDDTDYTPSGSAIKEDNGQSTTKRPRRKVRDSILSNSYRLFNESFSDAEAGSPRRSDNGAVRTSPRKPRISNDGKKELILTLRIGQLGERFAHFSSAEIIPQTDERPVALPRPVRQRSQVQKPIGGWDNKEFRFKFGWTPYPNHQGPTPDEAGKVFDLLRSDLATRGITVGPGERGPATPAPAHGPATGVTVDAMVRTLLSQATSNENALFVQNLLLKTYTYTVDGKQVQGTIPNYHTVHAGSAADLEPVIQACGLQEKRARFITGYLKKVYEANTNDIADWDNVHPGNPLNAPDFVPGLLSLDFLDNMSKVDLFNWLLSCEGVGIKTAHCLMEFSYRLPVCAVDTHVHYMAGALGWIPEECKTANNAAMHLDARLPDALKHDLHQAFWNHRQHCGPCKKAGGEKASRADATECVLEDRVQRRDTRAYRRGKKVVVEKAKVVKTTRKPSQSKRLTALTAEKAAAAGYILENIEWNDDFAAGSVNKKMRQVWKLVRE